MEYLKLCDSDYRFMTIVWDNAPVSSGALVKLCNEQLGWKKSTTYTAIKKLAQKGYLINEMQWFQLSFRESVCSVMNLIILLSVLLTVRCRDF